MALDTVGDYIKSVRRLLQDQGEPYRYPNEDLVEALNMSIMEARRLRPELFDTTGDLPAFPESDDGSSSIAMDPMYRSALTYYMAGHIYLRDNEASEEAKASQYLNKFVSQMLVLAS